MSKQDIIVSPTVVVEVALPGLNLRPATERFRARQKRQAAGRSTTKATSANAPAEDGPIDPDMAHPPVVPVCPDFIAHM